MEHRAFSVRLDRHPETLTPFRDRLRSWLTDVGVGAGDREDIVLACWEAAANALEHPILDEDSVAEAEIVVTKDDGHILVSVADEGRWRLRDATPERRGLGLRLIEGLMDRVEIVRTRRGTRVLMCRWLDHSY